MKWTDYDREVIARAIAAYGRQPGPDVELMLRWPDYHTDPAHTRGWHAMADEVYRVCVVPEYCKHCGGVIPPKNGSGPTRHYCGVACRVAAGHEREGRPSGAARRTKKRRANKQQREPIELLFASAMLDR